MLLCDRVQDQFQTACPTATNEAPRRHRREGGTLPERVESKALAVREDRPSAV